MEMGVCPTCGTWDYDGMSCARCGTRVSAAKPAVTPQAPAARPSPTIAKLTCPSCGTVNSVAEGLKPPWTCGKCRTRLAERPGPARQPGAPQLRGKPVAGRPWTRERTLATIKAAVALALFAAVAAWAIYSFMPGVKPVNPHDITEAQLSEVQSGMSLDQVEAILHNQVPTQTKTITDQPGILEEDIWWNPDLSSAANVWFTTDGTVAFTSGFNLP